MKKQDIVVHIKDEQMLDEAREILESIGEKIDVNTFFISENSELNYLYFHTFGVVCLGRKKSFTEITLQELKQLLNDK